MFAGDTSGMRGAIDAMPPQDMRLASNDAMAINPDTGVAMAMPSPVRSNATQAPAMGGMSTPPPAPAMSNISPQDLAAQAATRASTPGVESAGVQEGGSGGGPVRNIIPSSNGGATNAPQAPSGSAPNLEQMRGLTKVVHTPAGWHPSSQSVETKGAVQDPALQQAMLENYAIRSKEAGDRAEADKLQQMHIAMQSDIAANEAGKEKEAREQRERDLLAAQQSSLDEYKRIMGVKQGELADASKREVDQYRMYRGNTGAAIGAALAAGLGAFGASISHTPNFALDFITKSIDRDVEAQRDEINRGVASKQNDIARIRDQYNVSTPIAEKLLAINLTEKTQAMAAKQAALAGGQAAQEKLQGLNMQLADYRGKLLQDMQKTLYGDATVKADSKYSSGGDSVQLTTEAKRLKLGAEAYGATGQGAAKGAGGEYEASHEGRTAAQNDKQGGAGKESPRIAVKRATNESAMEDLPILEKADKGGYFVPGIHDVLKSQERKDVEAYAAALVSKLTDAAGDPATEAVRHDIYSRLSGADPEVRAKTRKALKAGTETYGTALERASERSRGVSDVNDSSNEK